ncbi:DUF2207 family protein [Amycolatopsis sp. NPDC059657]|uniref:DUF2207 family protein n=1 Tax=Amycolatopsis sp. NPDC059657 TaxID=3346899 RepID=UPI00366E3A73
MRAALLAAVFLLVSAGSAWADDPPLPNLPNSAEIQLKVERDGTLSVAEAVSVPAGTTMVRKIDLRVPAAHNRDRVYGIHDVSLEGAGSTEQSGDVFTVTLRGGTSILRYKVDGAVDDDHDVLHVSWRLAGGWDTKLALVRASFAAPQIAQAVSCSLGSADRHCGAAQIDHIGLTRFSQQNLAAGQPMDIAVELPAGSVPANAEFAPSKTLAGAFVLTTPVVLGWILFAMLAVIGGAWLWLARRRDAEPGDPLPVEVVSGDDADAVFASPDGVLPGHVGTVLSGRADEVDLAATVLDLAVRNYLWVEESEDDGLTDWRLTRRNPPDEHLTDFERAVFELVLPGDTRTLSELRTERVGVAAVRTVLREDVVGRRWLRRGGTLSRRGLRVVCYGLFLTAVLAFTIGYAQLGVAVAIAGLLTAFAARFVPSRTDRGRQLRRRLLGLRDQLHATRAKGVPKLARDLVFSRALPYALTLGEVDDWVNAFNALKSPPKPYWYGGVGSLRRVSEFTAALVGTFAGSRRGRRLEG